MELENVAEIEVEIQESGPAGEQGPPGLSAYEVYLVNGGTLSEKEWLESLKGETGKEGHTPVKGEDYFTEEDIASLKIPTKVSDLENDSGFITEDDITVGTPVITIKSIAGPGTNGSSPTTWFSDTEVCEALSKHINDSIGNAVKPINIVYGNNLEYYSAFHSLSSTIVSSGTNTNNYYMTSYVENYKDYATIMNTNGIHQRALSTLFIRGEWVDNVYTCTSYSIYRRVMSFIDGMYISANTLTKANTTQYEPTSDYNPATKKYVDDTVAAIPTSTETIKTFEIEMSIDTTDTSNLFYRTIDDSVRSVLNELVAYCKNTNSEVKLVIHNTNTKSNVTPYLEFYMRDKLNQAGSQITLYGSYYYAQKYYETSFGINYNKDTGLLLENDSDIILQIFTFQSQYLKESTYNVYPTGTYHFDKNLPQSSIVPSADVHLANKKYVDDSVATLGDYVDEQLANIDAPDIDLSEYATVEYVDNNTIPMFLITDTDGLANMTESKHSLGGTIANAIRDFIKNVYDKGFTQFIIKEHYAKSTVTNFYGRCVELYFTISGTTITLVNRYVMAPYSGGYTRYLATSNLRVVDGEIKGDSMNTLFTIKYLGDYKDVSGAIVTEDYVNNAVLGAKGSQIYQLNITDKVSTSGRDLSTTELSEFRTICNEILASNDSKAQLKLYLKGDKYIGFMYPEIEYMSTEKTIYDVIKSSRGTKYLQGKLGCSTNPAGTNYAFFDVTMNITSTYNSTTNTVSITKVHIQSNVNNHVYNVMGMSSFVKSSDVLKKTNGAAFTPTANYHPATKKYVDDAIAAIDIPEGGGSTISEEQIGVPRCYHLCYEGPG